MTAIPNTPDPTLAAVDRALEAEAAAKDSRGYLGASSIGRPCKRALWYDMHWCTRPAFDSATLRRFGDGHRAEDVMAARLRMVPGIQLWTLDERTGRQFAVSDHGGHLKGHLDGVIVGLLQAPKTPHVWEHKAVKIESWRKLKSLVAELGEKAALQAWNETYYAQAQVYMHYMGLSRHYLTVDTPGSRETTSCRTNYNKADAEKYIARAGAIINAPEPLERLSERPEFFECRWCTHHGICHDNAVPEVNCRTCAHSTPEPDGQWSCAYWSANGIPLETQLTGCDHHVFLPALIPAQQVDASEPSNWVEYQCASGRRFRNGDGHWTSHDVRAAEGLEVLTDEEAQKIANFSAPAWSAHQGGSPKDKPAWIA